MPDNSHYHSDPEPPVELCYDGSATGCLCAVAEAYKRRQPVLFACPGRGLSLFQPPTETVAADAGRASRFLQYIAQKSSRDVTRRMLWAVTAMPNDLEPHLLGYARKAVEHGSGVIKAHADPDVLFIHQHARKVSSEIHRFKGLLRFQEFRSGRFVALYEPDYDITLPLSFHFQQRLASQRWVILDCRRQQAATWNGTRLNAETPQGELLTGNALQACLADDGPSDRESYNQQLWQTFHRTVAIENRTNSNLQRQLMPSRYWKHLTEMQP